MKKIAVDFSQKTGVMKPMHAVNNGPVYKFGSNQRITNIDAFRDAGIPYARNHDAAHYSAYGGEHTVDVHAIFPNFDADPYDENAYDFACTDEYIRVCELAGVKTFYRLGSKIEHWIKKYGTFPPPDFKKWAIICEHIIRHYTQGWANGFHYDIVYWEIWNEPDVDPDDAEDKRCWQGTAEQFYAFYKIAATHLKESFPHLKIGGPAACYLAPEWYCWVEAFLNAIGQDTPLDFFSWHIYSKNVEKIKTSICFARELLDRHGRKNTESILNEWNYVKGWENDEWIYSLKSIKGLKGASFTAGVMCTGQYTPVDMLMYYDARPCIMNGLFCTDWLCECLKGYYPFKMFNALYKLKNSVAVKDDSNIYIAAADGDHSAIMLTYFDDNDQAGPVDVQISLAGLSGEKAAEIYLLDQTHDMELVRSERVTDSISLHMPLYSTVLIKLL